MERVFVLFFGFWVHVLFSSLPFHYQHNRLSEKIRLRNDLCYVSSGTLNPTN